MRSGILQGVFDWTQGCQLEFALSLTSISGLAVGTFVVLIVVPGMYLLFVMVNKRLGISQFLSSSILLT